MSTEELTAVDSGVITIRAASPADADAWLRMRNDLWPDHGSKWHAAEIAAFFAGTLREPLAVVIAAGDRGEAIGFAELNIRPYAEGCLTGRVAYLEGWYVEPHARRCGVGMALIRAAESWARAQGCTEFASDALVDNAVSAEAHKAAGFTEVEVIRCFMKTLDPRGSNA
jgi:aminoglycoside 6'-N-acetyltransferase I